MNIGRNCSKITIGNFAWTMKYASNPPNPPNPPNPAGWGHMTPIQGNPIDADIRLAAPDAQVGAPFGILGDFDGDGRDEIAIAKGAPGTIGNDFWTLKLGPGNLWTHMSPQAMRQIDADFDCSAAQIAARFAVVGDFDGDGRDEIAIAKEKPGTVGNDFWVMDFDPTTKAWQHMVPSAVAAIDADFDCSAAQIAARFAVVGDFDGDGRDEIAIAKEKPGTVGNDFWVMDFDPTTKAWQHMVPSTVAAIDTDFDCSAAQVAARFAVVGDFDGDGRDEIAIAKEKPGTMGNDFWAMDFDPTTKAWQHMVPSAVAAIDADFDCTALAVHAAWGMAGDLDGDGCDEIVVIPSVPFQVFVDLALRRVDLITDEKLRECVRSRLKGSGGVICEDCSDAQKLGYNKGWWFFGDQHSSAIHLCVNNISWALCSRYPSPRVCSQLWMGSLRWDGCAGGRRLYWKLERLTNNRDLSARVQKAKRATMIRCSVAKATGPPNPALNPTGLRPAG